MSKLKGSMKKRMSESPSWSDGRITVVQVYVHNFCKPSSKIICTLAQSLATHTADFQNSLFTTRADYELENIFSIYCSYHYFIFILDFSQEPYVIRRYILYSYNTDSLYHRKRLLHYYYFSIQLEKRSA